ncbi:hypothetical protein EC9_05690 [Rosistilla ulvae]|uniref:Uncharacterized protein n=2 Tax=Rosistilla TaxID=2795779 RepID=A0A517LUV7_9BACT|nr:MULTISPECIES: hypothetical protein [Rosistilla]QDS86407.1 hypothetical protein EC9_05690 [Rosistilla ulvae]QDV66762.1 hypothetical protein Poly24_04500 [Rosistilla carotiformis]
MRFVFVSLLAFTIGCGAEEVVELPAPVEKTQLVATIDQIAATGQFDEEMLTGLTMGLEEAGLMGEAALVQQYPTMGDEAQVKKKAKQLSKDVKKKLEAGVE